MAKHLYFLAQVKYALFNVFILRFYVLMIPILE